MTHKSQQSWTRRSTRWVLGTALAFSAGVLAGCDSLLEVELPGQITEASTFTPAQAPILVSSAIADMECSFSDFAATVGAGNDDAFARITGWWNGAHEFQPAPDVGECNTSSTDYGWYTPLHSGRWMAEQVYGRMDTVWAASEVPDREVLMAQSAIYAGLAYTQLGEHFCEVTANTGPLMSWDESLAEAEDWYEKALGHIGNAGDFAVPTEIAPSAEQLTYLLRARTRLARGDLAGASQDAQQVSQGFTAYVTRDDGGERTRWNKFLESHNQSAWNTVIGPIDWWDGAPDPVTGQPWPDTIPFTGYRNLGILPDGRAVTDSEKPITTDDYGTAVADPRVPVDNTGNVVNNYEYWTQQKYPAQGTDIPLAKWEEAWLIIAQAEGGQEAIDRVNDIRQAHGLPEVTYLTATDTEGIEDMIIEEIRRTHFLEGRYWAAKLRYDLWFPRGQGSTNYPYNYDTGVRMVMPTSEYELNPNLTLTDRGSLCPQSQDPT